MKCPSRLGSQGGGFELLHRSFYGHCELVNGFGTQSVQSGLDWDAVSSLKSQIGGLCLSLNENWRGTVHSDTPQARLITVSTRLQ